MIDHLCQIHLEPGIFVRFLYQLIYSYTILITVRFVFQSITAVLGEKTIMLYCSLCQTQFLSRLTTFSFVSANYYWFAWISNTVNDHYSNFSLGGEVTMESISPTVPWSTNRTQYPLCQRIATWSSERLLMGKVITSIPGSIGIMYTPGSVGNHGNTATM